MNQLIQVIQYVKILQVKLQYEEKFSRTISRETFTDVH